MYQFLRDLATANLSKDDWRAAHPDLHPVFDVPGVSVLNVCPDLMHTKHLGTDAYFYGSVLKLLVGDILKGNLSDNTDLIWRELMDEYTNLKVLTR